MGSRYTKPGTVVIELVIAAATVATSFQYANAAEIEDNEFLSGYRTEAFQAADDIKHHREPQSTSQSTIPCQANWSSEFCTGYKAGYSHKMFDEVP
jgi:hypothetical protein